MKEVKFVNAEDISSVEDYAAALLTGMISLKTLENYHYAAYNKGLLDEDEGEVGKTICWEIQKLLKLYKTQIENVLDRSELNEEDILKSFKSTMPDVKIPRKKKTVKAKEKKGDEIPSIS